LNWSRTKKAGILVIIAIASGVTDFNSAIGPALLPAQAEQWQLSPNHVGYANNLNVLCQ
jgi:hypothetical protein